MKHLIKLTIFLAVALIAAPGLQAQLRVDEDLRVKEWTDTETIEVFGHPITRVFGETYERSEPRNYHIPITNVGYKTLDQLIADTEKKAEKKNWSDERLNTEIENLKSGAPGGRIYVYIERRENDRANGKYYFIVLRNGDEEEFFRKSFSNQPPEFGDFGFWGNLFTADLPKPPPMPFLVYVHDRKSEHLADFKFKVLE